MLTLRGSPHSTEGITAACKRAKSDLQEDAHPHVDEFCEWFIRNI